MLSNPRLFFGVHSVAFYSRLDGTFYGILKVLQSSSLQLSGTLVPLKGGSNKWPWAVEEGPISSQLNLKFSQYEDFVYQLFGGATPTEGGADALGAASTLTNVFGSSCKQSTTGVASVSVITGSEGDLKYGKYVLKVITTTTVQVYCSTDADFGAGTAKQYASDILALSATNFTITSGADTVLTGFGLKLTGGSGAIAMTVGDTASFEVKPKNTANSILLLGAVESVFPEFGAMVYGKKRNGELVEVDCPRVKGEGVPLNFDEDKWSQADVKAMVMFDAVLNYAARIRTVIRTSAT